MPSDIQISLKEKNILIAPKNFFKYNNYKIK